MKNTAKIIPNRQAIPLNLRFRPELVEAVKACAAKNRRKITQEVEIALERHLAECGVEIAKVEPAEPAPSKAPAKKRKSD